MILVVTFRCISALRMARSVMSRIMDVLESSYGPRTATTRHTELRSTTSRSAALLALSLLFRVLPALARCLERSEMRCSRTDSAAAHAAGRQAAGLALDASEQHVVAVAPSLPLPAVLRVDGSAPAAIDNALADDSLGVTPPRAIATAGSVRQK